MQDALAQLDSVVDGQDFHDFQLDTLADSDYLNYPTPSNFNAATDIQMSDTGDFKNMFGWGFPEWEMDEAGMGLMNLEGGPGSLNQPQ